MIPEEDRPDPESFLAEARAECIPARGKLKIFLGAAPGVGKTFAMLEEARARAAAGTDVLVGIAETHGRAETAAILAHLEQVPRRIIPYRGKQLSEMDLDAILARRPQVVLIDELAHSNIPSARHPKRWQDVEEVLEAGIDVYSTLNIQHIESLNDVVAGITGIRVQETVPDAVLQDADDIKVIDLSAEDLIQRMREGKVYMPAQAGRALMNFFTKPNLTALRELALRTAASRIDAEMLDMARSSGRRASAQGRLMVCLDDPATARTLVRMGRRMTDRARIPWIVATVITPGVEREGPGGNGNMVGALELAERLGADTLTLRAESDPAAEFLAAAERLGVTRLIVARHRRRSFLGGMLSWIRPSVSEVLIDRAEQFELTVLSPAPEGKGEAAAPGPKLQGWPRLLAEGLGAAAVSTLIAWPFYALVPVASLAVVYLVGVLFVGVRRGTLGAIIASGISFMAYNYFFTIPFYSLRVSQYESVVALMVFTISALFTGSLAGRLKRQVEFMRVSQARTGTLYDFARRIASASTTDQVLAAAAEHIAQSVDCQSLILMPDNGGILQRVRSYPDLSGALEPQAFAAALWAFQRNEPAGSGTGTLPSSPWLFLPLAMQSRPIGVIGAKFADPQRRLDPETRRVLEAVEDQVAVAVSRIMVEGDLERARLATETEKLRAALLNSVSHDLRTPLVTVIGALTAMADGTLQPAQNADLTTTALDEARRLDRFVGNLLNMTRLGHGKLLARREISRLTDIVGRVRADLARPLQNFDLRLDLPADLPPVLIDPVLIGQALTNLVENATKYAPDGTAIYIYGQADEAVVHLTVEDEGPGIPPAERRRVFEMFHRAVTGDGAPAGTGLGLAIAKGMVEANDGTIAVVDPQFGPGAAIRMTFAAAEGEDDG
ncbi:sensor histidine kinase KdpD [Paracoccus suum]|uniref:histidine kinase n=1 Tax=Paracoccus suum TaxID=2259340 RepID=A0A344PN07_9RHOB|nr:sensor histidine kinase KdpD [Paracoccus suum]AXC50762.1 sensor histidine kinase KdpD [Paracoccus suum]